VKKSFILSAALALPLLFNSFVSAQNPPVASTRTTKTESAAPSTSKQPDKTVTGENVEQDVAEALSVIESNYVGGKKIDYNDLFKSSIDSMLHTLDPHSNYFDAKEFDQFRTDQSSKYFGIGATIGDLSDAKGNVIATYIKSTFENAPANRAGLRYGDKIVSVNGVSMLGKPFTEVRNVLRGPRGTPAGPM